jgi:hypothetical protein
VAITDSLLILIRSDPDSAIKEKEQQPPTVKRYGRTGKKKGYAYTGTGTSAEEKVQPYV